MTIRRRRPIPVWERGQSQGRRSPTRSRRPRAYDGGQPTRSGGWRRRTGFNSVRSNPLRSGLVGLVIAGTAAPIAIQRYDAVSRVDPAHERLVLLPPQPQMDDLAVAEAWRTAEQQQTQAAGDTQAAEREQTITANLERYREYNIPRELAEQIYDNAVKAEVDPDLAFGLVHAESSFKNSATSHVGAVGLTQLMPRTAEWLEPGVTRSQLRNPETNLRIGLGYLKTLVDKYDGDTKLALLAYNRGPGTVDRVLKRGGNPDNGYEDLVNKRRRG